MSRGTVQNWIVSGLLPFEELPGRGDGSHRFRLIRKSDLDVFLDKNYHKSKNESTNKNSDELILIEK